MVTRKVTGLVIFAFFGGAYNSHAADESEGVMESLPEHLIYLYTEVPKGDGPSVGESQLVVRDRRWEPNRLLRVCTFGGNKSVVALIRKVASEWNAVSSVKLDFGPAPDGYNCLVSNAGFYQIRIGFSERGYWSVLGKDSESRLDPLVPSMNLESFNRIYSEARYPAADITTKAAPYDKAVIRHEFGHALGLLHEHQNPSLKCQDEIKWEGPGNVYDYFAGSPNFWSASQVERNLGFIQNTDPDYQAGLPDAKSVMMYSLPKEIFKNGSSSKCYVSVNYEISAKDKEIIAKIYPTVSQGQVAQYAAVDRSTVKALPLAMARSESSDIKSRILVDLESNDDYVRRDARVRLASFLQSSPEVDANSLIRAMNGASYRYKLGVAVALAKSSESFDLDSQSKKILKEQANATDDPTLEASIESALKKAGDHAGRK